MIEEPSFSIELEIVDLVYPELRLWSEVLLMAVLDAEPWIKQRDKMSYDQVNNGKKALNWLLSESKHEGGFHWICSLINLDPTTIRKKIGIAGKKNIW